MTIAERIQLHRLGYSKEEIAELAAAGYDPAGLEDQQEPEQEPQQAPEQEPQQAPEQAPAPQSVDLTEIRAALEKLTAAIQGANIQQARQPQAPDPDADLTKVFDSIYK